VSFNPVHYLIYSVIRRNVRSYEKLVALLEKRDGPAAERHWRAHMEAAGQRLLGGDLQHRTVVDLFG